MWGFRHARPLNRSAPIAQNYHALVQSASIGDGARQLAVLTRRTMAVASQANGALEYMLARRLIDGNDNQGTALSGPIFTLLTVLRWIYVGIHMCKALPSPVCA